MDKVDTVASESNIDGKLTFSGKPFSSVEHFVNSDGNYIFCQYWKPEKPPKALVLIVHGGGEHCRRHNLIAQTFLDLGLLVFSHDHICHGESEGYKLDIPNYETMLQDLVQHYTLMRDAYPELPIFLFGHSMGGALAILLAHQNPGFFKAVMLSSPMISKHPAMTRPLVLAAQLLSNVIPRVPVAQLDANLISRDPNEVNRYCADPLVYHEKIPLRTGYQLFLITNAVEETLSLVDFPFLVLHGSGDAICAVNGTEDLFRLSKSTDKTKKIFDGGFHELAHDAGSTPDEYVSVIKDWLIRYL